MKSFIKPITVLSGLIFSFCLPSQLLAQRALEDALNDPRVQTGLTEIDNNRDWSARQLVDIGGIISPSGQEHERAAAVAALMRDIGLEQVEITDSPNAIGMIPGRSGQANGGLPNVNQGIARAVDRILQIRDPELYADRRTRLNVAVLDSGAVFNHKPESGWFSLDIRSLDPEHIESMEQQTRDILAGVTDELGIRFDMEPVSQIPPGQIPGALESKLVQDSLAISEFLGSSPRLSNAGSANLNVAIAGGSLAIGISSERGGRRGFADEWADIPVLQRTAKNVFLTAVTQAGRP